MVQSRQTDRQTDRKRCIWAHRANYTGGLKKDPSGHWQFTGMNFSKAHQKKISVLETAIFLYYFLWDTPPAFIIICLLVNHLFTLNISSKVIKFGNLLYHYDFIRENPRQDIHCLPQWTSATDILRIRFTGFEGLPWSLFSSCVESWFVTAACGYVCSRLWQILHLIKSVIFQLESNKNDLDSWFK